MSSIGTGYDLSCTTFSPDGRVFQVEYAGKAADNSGTAIGIRASDGVVLAVEKILVSKMLVEGSNRRIQTADDSIGIAFAGIFADARQLVKRARSEAVGYRDCTIVGGYSRRYGPSLHMIEPSGLCLGYKAVAVGKARQSTKTELEKLKLGEMTCREAVFDAARLIYLAHDEMKDKPFELEMTWISPESDFRHVLVPKDLRGHAIARAQEVMERLDE